MLTIAMAGGVTLLAAMFAYRIGRIRGRGAERVAVDRLLHDTVLPTLDALALGAPPDAARAQAVELRGRLREQVRPQALGHELATVLNELSRKGLRAHLVIADPGTGLPARRRVALRDATREALRNIVRHAGTNQAEVRVERLGAGIAVTTRDRGIGFDQTRRRPGFGITESIVARMVEVDGWAEVVSQPGWGTRVRLWVPR
ncbi:MAG TPA: ATP-binding protein [Actinophytocola sp.]|uniref:sensor histidine kinase n=1 Tax=Actinophytocola sp. TaxID=1872138 RepID=UPI002DB69AFB|nr:ATP-binding protein [Actinophytocola sp.]HEU5475329.1 ATP-binding protein [Actinophytocola sp.]